MRNVSIKKSSGKLSLVFASLILITFIFGCSSSDDDPGAPSPTFNWTPVTEEVIGSGGGTIAGDDFSIIIPPNAFSTESTVVVGSATPEEYAIQDSRFGSDATIYHFSGLPEFSEPLTIELAFDPAVHTNDDSLTIYFEEDAFVDGEDDPVPAGWPLMDVVVDRDAGVIRATIPPHVYDDVMDPLQKFTNDIDFVVTRSQQNVRYTTNDDFSIMYLASEVSSEWVDELMVDLITAKAKLDSMGFTLNNWTRIRVQAVPLPDKDGNFIQSNICVELSLIQVNPNLEGDERLVCAGHELFHLYQQGYGLCGHHFRYSHRWLSEACSIWFERVLLEDPNYVPQVQTTNANFISKGLEANTEDIGYGAGTFLTWLTDKYDRGLVLEINQKVAENPAIPGAGVHAVGEALLDRGSYLNAEFRLFAREYALGTTGHSNWATPPTDNAILTYTTTSKNLSISAMDLSAHTILSAINLNTWPTNPSPPHYLNIDVSSNTPPYVEAFVYRSSTITGPWSLAGVAEAGETVSVSGFGTGSQSKVKVVLLNSKGDVPCTDIERTTVSLRLSDCDETPITDHGDVYLKARVAVNFGTAPGDSVPVTVVYNKIHCDGHLGTVGPISGVTNSYGVYNAGTMAGFSVHNEQELYKATATVNGVTQEKVFTLHEMDNTFFFEPKIAEFIFQF